MDINEEYDIAKLLRVKLIAPESIVAKQTFHPKLEVRIAEEYKSLEPQMFNTLQKKIDWKCYFDIGYRTASGVEPITETFLRCSYHPELFKGKCISFRLDVQLPKPGNYVLVARVRTANDAPWENPYIHTRKVEVTKNS